MSPRAGMKRVTTANRQLTQKKFAPSADDKTGGKRTDKGPTPRVQWGHPTWGNFFFLSYVGRGARRVPEETSDRAKNRGQAPGLWIAEGAVQIYDSSHPTLPQHTHVCTSAAEAVAS